MPKQEVLCRIVDAEFNDEVMDVDDGESKHELGIVLTLRLEESGEMVPAYLTENDVRGLTGLQRPLSSMELVKFAHELSNRTEPMKLVIDPQEDLVTSEMIAMVPESVKDSLAYAMHEAVDEFDASQNLDAQLAALHRLHLLIENAVQQVNAEQYAENGPREVPVMSARQRVQAALKKPH